MNSLNSILFEGEVLEIVDATDAPQPCLIIKTASKRMSKSDSWENVVDTYLIQTETIIPTTIDGNSSLFDRCKKNVKVGSRIRIVGWFNGKQIVADHVEILPKGR